VKPLRRKQGLVVKELSEEILVYDLDRHRAHCLNKSASIVFKHCDGKTTTAEMARILRRDLEAPADREWVDLAAERLRKAHLLEGEEQATRPRYSRREMVRRVGLGTAALLPLVRSLLAPTPVEAAGSCVDDCSGQLDGTLCNPPSCTSTCSGGICV
jgi:hypothetical protein